MSNKPKETKLAKKPKIVYTSEEEDWLVTNVLEYRGVIENKKTDGATNRDKDKAWEKVTAAFNIAPPGPERTTKSLREKYQKIKQMLKDRAFYFSKDAKQTGGGPPKKELRPLTEAMQQLAVLLAPSTLGLAATSGDSDYVVAYKSALQCASQELNTSNNPAVTFEEIAIAIVDGAHNFDDNEMNAIILDNTCIQADFADSEQPSQSQVPESATDFNCPNQNKEPRLSKERDIVDHTWDRANPAKLRTPKNPLLKKSLKRKMDSDLQIRIPTEQKQQHLATKNKIEIEILESERERYKFERERADFDRKRAAVELERAELDRDRSAIELQWTKNKLHHDKELQRLSMTTLQLTSNSLQAPKPSIVSAAAKKEYD